MERLRCVRGSVVDPERRAELFRRISTKPKTQTEKKRRVLDLLEWSLAEFVPRTVRAIAEFRAKPLLDKPHLWSPYIGVCEDDRWAWEQLSGLVRLYRGRAREQKPEHQPSAVHFFPPPLADWILDVACGDVDMPTWEARPKQNEYRDLNIAIAIARLHELGLPYAPPSDPSACHLVAKRVGKSVSRVREIWFDQRNQIRALKANFGEDWFSIEFEVPGPRPH